MKFYHNNIVGRIIGFVVNILIIDYVDPLLTQLLDSNQIPYTYSPDTHRKEVLNIISQYDGLIVRNKLQINEAFLL